MGELIRLNKYLAHTMGLSRRQADEAIAAGLVSVNGRTAELGTVVEPARQTITINNQELSRKQQRYRYLLLNKPPGYVCSRKQQGGTPTIYALLPREYHHLKVAGRLDKDSQGLVVLTDDGDLIFKLTHPKFAKKKVYVVGLNKPLKKVDRQMIEDGIELEDGVSKFQITNTKSQTPNTHNPKPNTYTVIMFEGRNRQIRRTFKALGYTVTYLERTQLGPYSLQLLDSSAFKTLNINL